MKRPINEHRPPSWDVDGLDGEGASRPVRVWFEADGIFPSRVEAGDLRRGLDGGYVLHRVDGLGTRVFPMAGRVVHIHDDAPGSPFVFGLDDLGNLIDQQGRRIS